MHLVRLALGALFLLLAVTLFSREEYEWWPIAIMTFFAIVLLYREVGGLLLAFTRLLFSSGKLVAARAKKVDEMRHCKCCGALAVYMITTCASTKLKGSIPGVQTIYVCREHHPNPEIGKKADELHAYIRKLHPGITVERIYPHNPY